MGRRQSPAWTKHTYPLNSGLINLTAKSPYVLANDGDESHALIDFSPPNAYLLSRYGSGRSIIERVALPSGTVRSSPDCVLDAFAQTRIVYPNRTITVNARMV